MPATVVLQEVGAPKRIIVVPRREEPAPAPAPSREPARPAPPIPVPDH